MKDNKSIAQAYIDILPKVLEWVTSGKRRKLEFEILSGTNLKGERYIIPSLWVEDTDVGTGIELDQNGFDEETVLMYHDSVYEKLMAATDYLKSVGYIDE